MITRDPESAQGRHYDLAVVGGGVYGIALCLEASRRGLATLLVEQGDFGGETSWNSLRIIHGGLRYLQRLDLVRFRESVLARRWWLSTFPELVEPLSCVMPLYGRGLKTPAVLDLALTVNQILSMDRNDGVEARSRLERGRILSRSEMGRLFPRIASEGSSSGVLWFDATMPRSERILVEMLHWATASGAVCLNYARARGLATQKNRVAGLVVEDLLSGSQLAFDARAVVNCAGPWSRQIAAHFDRDIPELFRPSLALNLLLDRPAPAEAAIALPLESKSSKTLFLCPWQGKILAGTYHAPWRESEEPNEVVARHVRAFLGELNRAMPDLELTPDDVLQVLWGRLPVRAAETTRLSTRTLSVDHGAQGGPEGLFSLSGVKFTTAMSTAKKTLAVVSKGLGLERLAATSSTRPASVEVPSWPRFEATLGQDREAASEFLKKLVLTESVTNLGDLFLRRTDWWACPRELPSRAATVAELLDWDADRIASDLRHLEARRPQL